MAFCAFNRALPQLHPQMSSLSLSSTHTHAHAVRAFGGLKDWTTQAIGQQHTSPLRREVCVCGLDKQ